MKYTFYFACVAACIALTRAQPDLISNIISFVSPDCRAWPDNGPGRVIGSLGDQIPGVGISVKRGAQYSTFSIDEAISDLDDSIFVLGDTLLWSLTTDDITVELICTNLLSVDIEDEPFSATWSECMIMFDSDAGVEVFTGKPNQNGAELRVWRKWGTTRVEGWFTNGDGTVTGDILGTLSCLPEFDASVEVDQPEDMAALPQEPGCVNFTEGTSWNLRNNADGAGVYARFFTGSYDPLSLNVFGSENFIEFIDGDLLILSIGIVVNDDEDQFQAGVICAEWLVSPDGSGLTATQCEAGVIFEGALYDGLGKANSEGYEIDCRTKYGITTCAAWAEIDDLNGGTTVVDIVGEVCCSDCFLEPDF